MAVGFESKKNKTRTHPEHVRALTAAPAAVFLCAALAVLTVWGGLAGKAAVVRAAGQPRQMEIFYCDGSNQGNPRMFNIFPNVGFRFVVPEGYKLDDFVILAAPTWGDQANAGFTADIYEWRGEYAETLDAGPVAERCVITHHQDNHSITMTFGYVPAGTYLVHIHSITDAIGSWESMCLPEEYTFTWAFYEAGIENTEYLPGTKIIISRDNDPHTPSRPTPSPEPGAETGETPSPEATDSGSAAEPTRERLTEAPAAEVNTKKGSGGLWAGITVAALAVAVTAAVIVLVARKDNQQSEN